MKNAIVNVAFAAFITANAVVVAAIAVSVAYYAYVDFIR